MMSALLIVGLSLGATLYEDTFAEGNRAYQDGRFEDALRAYRQLAGPDSPSAEVHYNMGNAYFRLGDLGRAIASYERALQLDPGLSEARDNLQVALSGTRRSLARPLPPGWQQALLFWDNGLTYRQVRRTAIAAWIVAWVLLATRLLRPARYVRPAAVVLLLVASLAGLSAYSKAHPVRLAVATEEEIPVRVGIDEEETVRERLYAGDRVRVERTRRGWIQVMTIDGERGWAPARSFAFVGEPPADADGGDAA